MTFTTYCIPILTVLLTILQGCGGTVVRPVEDTTAEQSSVSPPSIDNITRQPGDHYAGRRSIAGISVLIEEMKSYQPEPALEILRSLESLPSGELRTLVDSEYYGPEIGEWLELTEQIRTALIDKGSTAVAAKTWADYHYGHVINRRYFSELVSLYGSYFPVPSRVAVLLPETGGLSAAARAIRDGIITSYLEHPGDAVIRFYSSGENSEAALAAYLQAREDGATQIIGPLRIESTRALAGISNPDVPILLLNDAVSSTDRGQKGIVHSLSLSQAEEAAAIAVRALGQDHRQGIMIVPDNAWGIRIEQAFISAFEQGNGKITASARFNTTENDHSVMLTKLLKIDESVQRKSSLQSHLGIPLNFEPHRRSDFQFVFLAATPMQGRALKPLLRFHDAGDIPVYAMGRVFSGRTEQAPDRDLNGVVFPTTSWQLDPPSDTNMTLESLRGGTFNNLFALGGDAWNLIRWLPLMQIDPDLEYPGSVGALRLQSNGRLSREPVWAQFSSGRPTSYQWPEIP